VLGPQPPGKVVSEYGTTLLPSFEATSIVAATISMLSSCLIDIIE
jgi:hypothetical protein